MRDRSAVVDEALRSLLPVIGGRAQCLRDRREAITALHELRVALRRLRALLRTFADAVDAEWRVEVETALRQLSGPFGAARDLDVFVARLAVLGTAIDERDREAFGLLVAHFEHEQLQAHRRVRRTVRSDAWRALEARLADVPPVGRVIRDDARTRLRASWRKLVRSARRCRGSVDESELHGLRIEIKHLRYALDAAAPVLGASARRHARRLARVQDQLGERHDRVVSQQRLYAVAAERPELAFVAGALAMRERLAAREARTDWWTSWRAACRRRDRQWARAS